LNFVARASGRTTCPRPFLTSDSCTDLTRRRCCWSIAAADEAAWLPVFASFGLTDHDLRTIEVDVLDAKLESLSEAEAGPVK
jgi:hypothetical protein